jgi:hypothetical protein
MRKISWYSWMDYLTFGESDECWPWAGSVDANGYPQAKIGGRKGKVVRVHRVIASYFTTVTGPVHHICGNRRCLNPDHLMATKSQAEHFTHHRRTHCVAGHKLTNENIYITPRGDRQCRECRRRRQSEYQKRYPEKHRVYQQEYEKRKKVKNDRLV